MAAVLLALAKVGLALLWLMSLALLMTWVERKESAVIQDRIGANRASIFGLRLFGLFQPLADAVKMVFKEDFAPPFADRVLHALAPWLSFFFVSVTVAAVPFGPDVVIGGRRIPLQVADLDGGLVFVLAMLGLAVYGLLVGGWASNSRLSLLGGLRSGAQLVSYEIGLALSLVGLVLVFPTLRFSELVRCQGGTLFGFLPRWGIVLQPLGGLVFFLAALAETKRAPFDLPEGESEIVGFYTEYGGLKWGLFMMTDFLEVIIVSCLLTTLYFGGWQVIWLEDAGFRFPWGGGADLPAWVVAALRVAAFNLKVAFFCWLQVLIRWTYPRFRYDRLMRFGWLWLIPLAALNLVLTALFVLLR